MTVSTPAFAELAGTGDGRDITRPWIAELEQPRDPRLAHSTDWGVYDTIRKDDRVKAVMEQRVRAVVAQDWDVLPGDDQRNGKLRCLLRHNGFPTS